MGSFCFPTGVLPFHTQQKTHIRKDGAIMKTNKIITISRQLASGGRSIGKLLAEKFDIPYYDKELLAIAAKDSGISISHFEDADEQPTNSFLYNLSLNPQIFADGFTDYPTVLSNDRLFIIQSDTIRKISEKGPCVIVGRLADYILSENESVFSLFIHADMDYRAARLRKTLDIQENKIQSYLTKADKRRSSYYNYYTGKKWREAANYDLCVNAGKLGDEGAADAIVSFITSCEK